MLPICPDRLPDTISKAAEALVRAYLDSPVFHKLPPQVAEHWDKLIEEWSNTFDMPLFIRKQSADIGSILTHVSSNRKLAPCDNSPAHWAIRTAFESGNNFSLLDVRKSLELDKIPICQVMSKTDVAECNFKQALGKQGVYEAGWRLDHIHDVGLKKRLRVQDMDIEILKTHFRNFMRPSNMVLVPTTLKGLGDMPVLLNALRRA